MPTIIDKLNDILVEKQTKIIPENIKAGVTAFGITGILQENQSQNISSNNSLELIPNLIKDVMSDPEPNYGVYDGQKFFSYINFPQLPITDYTKVKGMVINAKTKTSNVSKIETYYKIYSGDTLKCQIGYNIPNEDDFEGGEMEMPGMASPVTFEVVVGNNRYSYSSLEKLQGEDDFLFDLDEEYVEPTELNFLGNGGINISLSGVIFKDSNDNVIEYSNLPEYIKNLIRLYELDTYRSSEVGLVTYNSSSRPSISASLCTDMFIECYTVPDGCLLSSRQRANLTKRWFKIPYAEVYKWMKVMKYSVGEYDVAPTLAVINYDPTPEVYGTTNVYTITEAYIVIDDIYQSIYRYGSQANGYYLIMAKQGIGINNGGKYIHYHNGQFDLIQPSSGEDMYNTLIYTASTGVGQDYVYGTKYLGSKNDFWVSGFKVVSDSHYETDGLPVPNHSSLWDGLSGVGVYGTINTNYKL